MAAAMSRDHGQRAASRSRSLRAPRTIRPAADSSRSRSRLGSQRRPGPGSASIAIQASSSHASATISHQIWFWSYPCRGRHRRAVSLAQRIRSSHRARRRCRAPHLRPVSRRVPWLRTVLCRSLSSPRARPLRAAGLDGIRPGRKPPARRGQARRAARRCQPGSCRVTPPRRPGRARSCPGHASPSARHRPMAAGSPACRPVTLAVSVSSSAPA
jgi:hypothetical protein